MDRFDCFFSIAYAILNSDGLVENIGPDGERHGKMHDHETLKQLATQFVKEVVDGVFLHARRLGVHSGEILRLRIT